MAVAFDAATTSDNAGSPAAVSHTASGSDRLVVALIKFEKDTTAVNGTPTYGGSNMTKFTEFDPANAIGKMEVWYLIAPATGAQTLSVAWTNTADDAMVAAASFTGVDQSTPLSGAATAEGNGAALSVAVVSAINDLVADFIAHTIGSTTFTPGADQTERFDVTTSKSGACGCTTEPGAASVTMSETASSSNKWMQIGFNIKAATAAASGWGRLLSDNRNRLVQAA